MVRKKEEYEGPERRSHLLEECPQAPVIAAQAETLHDLKKSNERIAVALETLAKRGAQVDSMEKRVDNHDEAFKVSFGQIRKLDERIIVLEIKKSEWEGAQKAEEKMEVKQEKEKTKIWTLLERLQLVTPVILAIFFLLWLSDKYG